MDCLLSIARLKASNKKVRLKDNLFTFKVLKYDHFYLLLIFKILIFILILFFNLIIDSFLCRFWIFIEFKQFKLTATLQQSVIYHFIFWSLFIFDMTNGHYYLFKWWIFTKILIFYLVIFLYLVVFIVFVKFYTVFA